MSKCIFGKYQGAGNDFILIDDRSSSFPFPSKERVAEMCHRRFGIGADGLILLQSEKNSDFRMRIFNADGDEAESCGNGLRCLLLFLADLGLPKKTYRIAIGDKIVLGEYRGEAIFIEMGRPSGLRLGLEVGPWTAHAVNTGVPHAVVFVPDVNQIDLLREAPFLRRHPIFGPQGANINFAHLSSDSAVRLRTFERGVEGETWACGTGAGAAAVIASILYRIERPIQVDCLGGRLQVEWDGADSLRIGGPARQVFSGTILADLKSRHSVK